MEKSDMTKTKYTSLFIIAAASIAFCAGCSKESAVSNETENIDLTQADLFEEPLKPDPLALQPEDVVVTVDGQDITHGEIMQAVQNTMRQLSQQMPPQQLSQMYNQVYNNTTDQLIANVLLTKASENSSLAVSEEELNSEIDKIKAGIPEGNTLEEALAENNMDLNEWKENLRTQILIGKFVEEKTADIGEATSAEVATFYQENIDQFKNPENVEASHILLSFTEEDTDATKAEKKAKLEQIKADIDAGASFEDIAKESSDCPSSQRGGNLGSFARGQMVPEFEDVAFTQEVGIVSDVVETQFGYHLIKVTDHQMEKTSTLAEVTDQLRNYLSGQKKQEALIEYVGSLREKADVVMHKQNMNSGAEEESATE
jgi:peptidyl-prolyl cis-trans isomerase C